MSTGIPGDIHTENEPLALHTMPDIHLPYLQLLNNPEAAVYICDAAGFITLYNKAAISLWGREPLTGEDRWSGAWKLYKPDGITIVHPEACPMALVLEGTRPISVSELILEKPNGERVYTIVYARPLRDENGLVTGAVGLIQDVSRYKKDEQKEEYLAAIVQYSDDAIISKTLDGIITSWNAGAERIFGYTAEEMIGQPLLKLIPRERWDEEYKIQEQLRNGNRIDHYETKRVTKDNRLLDVSLTISPVRDKYGSIIGASKIARDITRQKQDEVALRESEERYRLAVETAKLGTWALNPVSGETVISVECRAIFGIPEYRVLTLDLMLQMVYSADLPLVKNKLEKLFDPAFTADYDAEYRLIRWNDQDTRWVRVKGKMYFSTEGQPEKLIGTILDITDEKMAKEKLERTVQERTIELSKMNEQLQKSNHDLEQFAYIASHDLQEPLRKIQAFIDIIDDKAHPEGIIKTYFDRIRQSANRMSTLIRDVLNYSRLDTSETLFTNVDLNHTLENVMVDYESLINSKRAVIRSNTLPAIRGIPIQLRQLFANLISNSLKFSSGTPVIDITARRLLPEEVNADPSLESDKEYIELTFHDNGIGFEQQYAEKIFMIFQRLHGQSQYSGTGIGLALCRKIVENHHGSISGSSEPGMGASFRVMLPV